MGSPTVVLHCNAGSAYGMGHLMRSLALAEEANGRGWSVALVGDLDTSALRLARGFLPGLEVITRPREELNHWFSDILEVRKPDVLHLDTYWDVPDYLSDQGWVLSNMQDDAFGLRPAHLAIDANLGAENRFTATGLSTHQLLGVSAAVVRQQVRRQREHDSYLSEPIRVLIVLGGTDPHGLTARVVEQMDVITSSALLTVVCGEGQAEAVQAAARKIQHPVSMHRFLTDLPAEARGHTLVISAAGTSVWDFACMGVPMALVCAVDNQLAGYQAATAEGLAVPLGIPPYLDLRDRLRALDALLRDARGLKTQSARLREAVDGLGAWRIVRTWESLVEAGSTGGVIMRSPSGVNAVCESTRRKSSRRQLRMKLPNTAGEQHALIGAGYLPYLPAAASGHEIWAKWT